MISKDVLYISIDIILWENMDLVTQKDSLRQWSLPEKADEYSAYTYLGHYTFRGHILIQLI